MKLHNSDIGGMLSFLMSYFNVFRKRIVFVGILRLNRVVGSSLRLRSAATGQGAGSEGRGG
jgi:hypothetical protein